MATSINVLLLIELIAIVIAASAFLFYINRLGGSIVSFFIRLYTWRKHHAYITIGSLQISPLAGRISFRDIEYHSSNISARALHGHITWRYWKFRVRQSDDAGSTNAKRATLPCRIVVHAQGVEAFFYNRTPAYDAIVERMKRNEADVGLGATKTTSNTSASSHDTSKAGLRERTGIRRDVTKESSVSSSEGAKPAISHDESPATVNASQSEAPGVDWLREMLPIDFTIEQGSVILGNDATPMVLIGDFKRASGSVAVTDSKSPCDLYKLLVNFGFHQVKVITRINVDYSGPLLAHGKKAYDELRKERPETTAEPPSLLSTFSGFHQIAKRFPFLSNPKFSSPPVPGLPRDRVWRGLARYRHDDEAGTKAPRREEREYAKVTTLLETPMLEVTYFADGAGLVPTHEQATVVDQTDEIGNVEPAPEYGVDITLHGGLIKYGPWADRQRDALQTAFTPSIFFDSVARQRLKPGDTRLHTNLILNVHIAEETTLRIPTREPSKDWRYDANPSDVERRYGWLDIIVGPDSSVVYTQSQVATSHGYDSMIALHLDSLAIASSVNLETFIESKTCKLSITMPTPLRWDAQRDWGFDVTLEEPKITLMRDHTTLISDLARDWSSGQQGDFHHFVPNQYNFRVTILNYAVHLFINDYNIIDQPRSRHDNAMMDVYGPRLDAYIAVATTQYRPEFSVVPFTVQGQDMRVDIGVPRWDTHRASDGTQTLEVGKIGEITAEGSYRYYSEPKPDHLETLTLHLEGRRVAYKALGWVLRRMFCVKDNYFGGYTQFTTMQEFLERFDHDPKSVGDPVEEKYRPGRSDPYAVQVTMNVEDSLVVMSDEIYGCEQGLVIPVPQLQMSLRSQEHFMDLSLDSPPTYVVPSEDLAEVYRSLSIPAIGDEAIFFDGIELKANRLFGPQPRAETYLCLWEAVVPRITCFLSASFTSTLQSTLSAVAYTFDDVENAPARTYQVAALPDVTFFKLALQNASILFTADDSAVSVDLPSGIQLDLSTWATRFCSSSIGIIVPAVTVLLLRREEASHEWRPLADIRSGATIDIYKAGKGWRKAVAQQQAFIRREDAQTRRITYLYDDGKLEENGHFVHQVFVPIPLPANQAKDANDYDDSLCTTDSEEEEAPILSSPDDSDEDMSQPARAPRVIRRKSTSAIQHDEFSTDDEAETPSSLSTKSTSSRPSFAPDANDVLAAKMERTNAMRQALIGFNAPDDQAAPKASEGILAASPGASMVVKISIRPATMTVKPSSVPVVSCLLAAVKQVTPRPQLLLDKILVAHTDHLAADNRDQPPKVIEVGLTSFKARICPDDHSETGSVIDCSIRAVTVNMTHRSRAGHPNTDLTAAIHHFALSLCADSPDTQLKGFDQSDLPGPVVARIFSEGLELGHESRASRQCVVVRSAVLATSIVTPAFAHIAKLVETWQLIGKQAASRIPTSKTSDSPTAMAMYKTVRAAVEQRQTLVQPPFAYESGYGLHVNDQRNIRRDLGWGIVARVRHWHQTLAAAQDVPHDNVADYTVAALLSVEDWAIGTEAFIRSQQCMKIAFGDDIEHGPGQLPTSPDSDVHLFVKLDLLQVAHEGRTLESDAIETSRIKLVSTSIGMRCRKHDDGKAPLNQIRSINTIKAVDIEVRNNVLLAIEPMLVLIPSGGGTSPSSRVPPTSDTDEGRSKWSIAVDNHIGRGDVHVIGGGLRLSAVIESGSANLMAKTDQIGPQDRRIASRRCDALIGIRRISLTLSALEQSRELLSLPSDRTISHSSARDLKVVLNHHEGATPDIKAALRLALALDHFAFDVRPQVKSLASFGVNWKKQHFPIYQPHLERYNALSKAASPPHPSSHHSYLPRCNTEAVMDLRIGSAVLTLRAAKSLWVRWDIGSVYLTGSGTSAAHHFGLRVAPQLVGAYPSLRNTKSKEASKLQLPAIDILGTRRNEAEEQFFTAKIDLGVFTGIIKPATLDRLLSLHHQMAAEFIELSRQYGEGVSKAIKSARTKSDVHDRPKWLLTKISQKASDRSCPSNGEDPISAIVSSSSDDDGQDGITRPVRDIGNVPQGETDSAAGSSPGPLVSLDLRVNVEGVRVGLRADNVASTIWLEALDLTGQAKSESDDKRSVSWGARANHLGVSLGYMTTDVGQEQDEPVQKYRSASASLDVDIKETAARPGSPCHLEINLSKVHTVMHVAALKELSDLVRSWSHEIRVLREMRAAEMAEVKAQTSKIIKRLEARETDNSMSDWFAARVLTVVVSGIGIAIPLDAEASIDLSNRADKNGPALLFTIRTMIFENRRNQAARFRLSYMMLQFVESFDAGKPGHFSGAMHASENCMAVAVIDSEAQMSTSVEQWTIAAHSSANDFKLTLSPTIANVIFRLIALYRQGKKHITAIGKEYRSGLAKFGQDQSVVVKYIEESRIPSKLANQRIVVRLSFNFASGLVELAHVPFSPPFGSDRRNDSLGPGGRVNSLKPTQLRLPGISAWVDYVGATIGVDDTDEAGMLILNTAIHESTNTVAPTILPFFVDLVNRIRSQPSTYSADPDQSGNDVASDTSDADAEVVHVGESALKAIAQAPTGRLRISASLRIDKSTLTFKSSSDAALLDLTWDSGGFVASTTLGAYQFTSLAGTITGVAVNLRGSFDRGQSCLTAGAQDMAFSLAYCPSERDDVPRGFSFIFDTSIAAQFRLELYYAFLIMSTEWIDNAPTLAHRPAASVDDAATDATRPAPKLHLAIAVNARIRQVEFDTDLAISKAKLCIKPVVIQTTSNGEETRIEVKLGTTSLLAEGQLHGDVTSQSLVLRSTRRSSRSRERNIPSILSMVIEGGHLAGHALMNEKSVIQFELAPTKVRLTDDWSAYTDDGQGDVTLAFDIQAGKFTGVVRLSLLPPLLGQMYRLIDHVPRQEDRAAQASSIYRNAKERKINEPSVLAAALQSARKASLTSNNAGQVRTKEVVNLTVQAVTLGAFAEGVHNREVLDDFYTFQVDTVVVALSRHTNAAYHRQRYIQLDAKSFEWSNDDGEVIRTIEGSSEDMTAFFARLDKRIEDKLSESKASLPPTTVWMHSEQFASEPRDRLEHDCSLQFASTKKLFDAKVHARYWQDVNSVFSQLMERMNEQQRSRDRAYRMLKPSGTHGQSDDHDDSDTHKAREQHAPSLDPADLKYVRIGGAVTVPPTVMLGDMPNRFVRMVPALAKNMDDKMPFIVQKFLTIPLEDMMEQLLKVYEKLLPDKASEDDETAHGAEHDDATLQHNPIPPD